MNLNASFSLLRSSIARSRPIMIFAGSDPQLSLIHFGETINSNFSAFSCSSFSLCSPFLPDCHLNLSHQTVFFVGAAPPLSLDHSAGRKQPLSVEFHYFCHFSVTFIAAIAHIQPEFRLFQTQCQHLLMPPGLLLANKWPPMFLTGSPFYCRHRTRFNLCILLLLIIGGSSRSQSRPVIISQPHVRFIEYQVGGQ